MKWECTREGYVLYENEKKVGCLNWEEDTDGDLRLTHTFVDPSMRGQNIAKRLLEKTVEYARENQKRVVPICSYVQEHLDEIPGGEQLRK